MELKNVELIDDRGCRCTHYIDKNGAKQGTFKKFYPNEELYIEGKYKNGERHGQYIEYYPNGQVWVKANYKNGDRNGEYISYTPQGKIKLYRKYNKGQIINQTIHMNLKEMDEEMSIIEPECKTNKPIDSDTFINALVKNIIHLTFKEIKNNKKNNKKNYK